MRILNILSVLVLAGITTACGNIQMSKYDDLRTENYGQLTGANSENPFLTEAQQCSENPNITSPQYQYASATQYRGCKWSNSNSVNVKLYAETSVTKNVCIFPVRVTGTMATPFVVNPSAPIQSRYAVQCTSVSDQGATVNFGTLPLTGVYVVDQSNAAVFAQCIAYGDVRTCAANAGFTYSQGTL